MGIFNHIKMIEINKNHTRVKKYDAGCRINIPSHLVKKLGLEHNDLIDLSKIKKVVEK